MVIGARERLCEICDPLEGGALELGADESLKYREGVSVSVPPLQEEVFGGRWLVAARGLREVRRGGGSGWVGRDGGGVRGKGRLDDELNDCIYVHVRRWRRRRDRGRVGRRDFPCECSESGGQGGNGRGLFPRGKGRVISLGRMRRDVVWQG